MTFKQTIGTMILMLYACACIAQHYKTGAILDDTYNNYPTMPNNGNKSDEEALTKNSAFSLKAYCPKVGNQRETQTCVSWAIGYGAMSILQAVEKDWKGKPDRINQYAYSTYFSYNQLVDKKQECQDGLRIRDVIDLIEYKGNVLAKEFDGLNDVCGKTVPIELEEKAIAHRIANPLSLNDSQPRNKINNVKTTLLRQKPVVVCLQINKSFEKIGDNGIWNHKSDKTYRGIHALCIIGYDDGKGAFEIMNSWGEDWGNKGFAWIKYDDFVQYSAEVYTFSLNQNTDKLLSSKVYLRYPSVILKNDAAIQFDTFSVQYDIKTNIYDIKQRKISVGEQIQPLVARMKSESYLYVFSSDAEHQVKVYYPRQYKESPLITTTKGELVIPSDTTVIQLSKIGIEYLCFLWSSKPIANFENLISSLKNNPNALVTESIEFFFKDQIPPITKIRYERHKIGFSTYQEKACIVPIVIRLNVQ